MPLFNQNGYYSGPIGPSLPGYIQGTANNVPNYSGPIGPSSPGFVQGTANTVRVPSGGGTTGGGSNGQVLGSSTTGPTGPTPEELQKQKAEAELNNGYNQYFANLDAQLGTLNSDLQSGISTANNNWQQSLNTLNDQLTQGQNQLGGQRTQAQTQQAKTLRDISANVANSMQAGNLYLGARGAGDSSAANQYAYALTKLGTQQRTDVQNQTAQILNDIGQRETSLTNTYNTEVKNLELSKQNAINQVTTWFNDAQRQLQGTKGTAQLQKSQTLYNQAINQLNQISQESANQRSLLEQWAANHATDINQLKSQLASIGGQTYNQVQTPSWNATPQTQGTGTGSTYFPGAQISSSNTDKNSLFSGGGAGGGGGIGW